MELTTLMKLSNRLPESKVVRDVLRDFPTFQAQIQNHNRSAISLRQSLLAGLRHCFLVCIYWLPTNAVQAIVTMTVASATTLVLYVYLFILLPLMSEVLAILLLVVPVPLWISALLSRDLVTTRVCDENMGGESIMMETRLTLNRSRSCSTGSSEVVISIPCRA
jgi:hypothetical protein